MIEFIEPGNLRLYWRLFKLRMTSMYFGLSPASFLPAALICLLACVLGLSAVKTNMCFVYSSALLQSASLSYIYSPFSIPGFRYEQWRSE